MRILRLFPIMPLLLGVNIDHIATLRQARYATDLSSPNAEPCPVLAGHDAVAGGADSLTIHIRGDRRHMQDADAFQIRSELTVPLNLEMAVTEEMLGIALRLKPEFVCLVPENRQEITTEGGLDVLGSLRKIHDVVARLRDAGIRVSVFIDPELRQVDAAIEVGADMIELHTGAFANATGVAEKIELDRLTVAATHAHPSLQVNAGHGINFTNISQILTIPYLAELNIGHSIIARATRVGLTVAVREMKEAMTHYLA
jgi:pyridoxine 5-phosphate synthase